MSWSSPARRTIRSAAGKACAIVPWVFGVVAFVAGLGAWLASRYGSDVTHDLADAVGLPGYPDTVAGVLYGAAFTGLFVLSQLLLAVALRRRVP